MRPTIEYKLGEDDKSDVWAIHARNNFEYAKYFSESGERTSVEHYLARCDGYLGRLNGQSPGLVRELTREYEGIREKVAQKTQSPSIVPAVAMRGA